MRVPAHPAGPGCVTPPTLCPTNGSKMAPTVISCLQQCSFFPPHLIPVETKGWTSILFIFCFSLEIVLCIYIFFLLREWEITRHRHYKEKQYIYKKDLTAPYMEFFISGSTDKASQQAKKGWGFMLQKSKMYWKTSLLWCLVLPLSITSLTLQQFMLFFFFAPPQKVEVAGAGQVLSTCKTYRQTSELCNVFSRDMSLKLNLDIFTASI